MRGRSKKQRSGSRPAAAPVDEDVAVRRAASVKAIKTWDDVEHDSADDFDHSRDKVLVGYDRRLAKHDGSSDFDSDEEVLRVGAAASSESDASDSGDDDDAQAADGAWGSHKANYYNADDIGTDTDDDEAAAKEEEEEALRLQKRQLADLDEADFIDDFSTQLGVSSTADDRRSAARLVAAVDDSHAQIDLAADDSFDLSSAKRAALERLPEKEKLRVIEAEAPELLSLAADVESHWITVRCEIKPVLDRATALGVRADDHPALAFYTAKFQLLMSYLNNIAVYLVMKASTADERGHVELRDHPVIATIVEFRRRLALMDALQERLAPLLALFADELEAGVFTAAADPVPIADELPAAEAPSKRSKKIKPTKPSKGTTADNRPFLQGAPPVADSYAELQAMLRRERGTKSRQPAAALDDADLGEADQLDADDVDDKARASRRLRHHAKRITQARAKRGGRDALSGDADVPYKDRRSQQQQQQQSHYNAGDADLGSGDDAGSASDPGSDYYAQVALSAQQAKEQRAADKAARLQAQWQAMADANAAAEAPVADESKRNVNYQILKNRGLMPKRSKEQRNPRVKRRARYEQARKKLSSTIAQVRTLEGNYAGEATGIKANLTRSTRFK